MRETPASAALRAKINVFGFMTERIESHSTCPGIPDIYWQHDATRQQGWIEAKLVKDNQLELRPKQLPLIERWWKRGINVCIVAYHPGRKVYYLIPGDQVRYAMADLDEWLRAKTQFSYGFAFWKDNETSRFAGALLALEHFPYKLKHLCTGKTPSPF